MIDWSVVEPALLDIFSELAPESVDIDPPFRARWAEQKAGFINPTHKGEVILRIVSVADIGEPESRFRETDAGAQECMVGQQRVMLEVRCTSFDHTAKTWAITTAGRIRLGLRRTNVIERLASKNIAIPDVGPARDVAYTVDGRRVNASLFEVTLNVGFHADNPESFGVIERIEATSNLKGVDDVRLSEPLNFTDQLMP